MGVRLERLRLGIEHPACGSFEEAVDRLADVEAQVADHETRIAALDAPAARNAEDEPEPGKTRLPAGA
jgi:hypothetical protein